MGSGIYRLFCAGVYTINRNYRYVQLRELDGVSSRVTTTEMLPVMLEDEYGREGRVRRER